MSFQDIKVEFVFTSDDMSDKEYEDQVEQEFIVTQDMIYDLVRKNIDIPEGKEMCQDNFWINMKK